MKVIVMANSSRKSKWVHCLVDKEIHDRLDDLKKEIDGVTTYEELFDKISRAINIANQMEGPEDRDKVSIMLNILNEGD